MTTLTGHTEEVLDVCFDLTGQLIATASADGNVYTPNPSPSNYLVSICFGIAFKCIILNSFYVFIVRI